MNKEKVYTVENYYDEPRSGIANFEGKPHVYECTFDYLEEEYSNRFKLMEVSNETLQLALKAWHLWIKWDNKPDKSKVELDSHPVLPKDKNKHIELSKELNKRLKIDETKAFFADGKFESYEKGWNGYQVEWKIRKEKNNL